MVEHEQDAGSGVERDKDRSDTFGGSLPGCLSDDESWRQVIRVPGGAAAEREHGGEVGVGAATR